jgi:hypothetical protein
MCIFRTIAFMRRYTCAKVMMCTYTCRHDYADFYCSYLQKGAAMSTLMCTYTTRHCRAHAYNTMQAQVVMQKLDGQAHIYSSCLRTHVG